MTLPLEGGSVRNAQDLFSEALWSALVGPATAKDAVAKIAYSPKLREEALRIADELSAMAAPMTADRLRLRLAETAKARGLGSLSGDDLARVLKPYMAPLEPLPEHVFDSALAAWDRGDWFKKPGDFSGVLPKASNLLDLAKDGLAELTTVMWRLRKVQEAVERFPKPKAQRTTKADLVAAGVLDADGKVIWKKSESEPIPEAF